MLWPGLSARLPFGLAEDAVEVARTAARCAGELFRKSIPPRRKPAHRGDAGAVFLVLRQIVALRIVEVLQPVLEIAQEYVSICKLLHCDLRKQMPLFLERRASACSVGRAVSSAIAPAAHQLQRLRDELDLADAAGAELDVLGESRRATSRRTSACSRRIAASVA